MTDTATPSKLGSVIIPVADQDRQLEFYTEVLGLEKRADVPFGPGRWIEVAPRGAETPIALCPPGPDSVMGNKTSTATTSGSSRAALTSTPRSAASAARCPRCSGSVTRRAIG
jgi:catechol 2,3-dioxygenase-like lactoylglutathione lyase family enzyme